MYQQRSQDLDLSFVNPGSQCRDNQPLSDTYRSVLGRLVA